MNNIIVKSLTMDSRQVNTGDVFIAVRGLTVDGRQYIEEALQKGAAAILVEPPFVSNISSTVPIIPIPNLKNLVGHIAARFFAQPSQELPVVGITGTNGKTSISHFIAQIYAYCQRRCAVIGTLGTGFLDSLKSIEGTTPDAIAIQKLLREFKDEGATLAAMEVTSHALDQGRVEGVRFHSAVFSNLTRDHLDYHRDMEQYAATKQKLFTEFKPHYSIINVEDAFGKKLIQDQCLEAHQEIIGYTTDEKPEEPLVDTITSHQVVFHEHGISAFIKTPWGEGKLHCALLGRFNLSNLLAALAVVCIQGIPLPEALEAIQTIQTVAGRMMRYGGNVGLPLVVIDYAHTPDALLNVLQSLRQYTRGNLWCVFGCGGDRDKGKRALMMAIAEEFSDKVCLTEDNPRTEDPKQILTDMLQGAQNKEKILIESNRKKAIDLVVGLAKAEDVILIAGKGHEPFQIIGTQKIPYSDEVQVKAALSRRTR